MSKLISFFEIPASDFNRAVKFYETIFGAEQMLRYSKEFANLPYRNE